MQLSVLSASISNITKHLDFDAMDGDNVEMVGIVWKRI